MSEVRPRFLLDEAGEPTDGVGGFETEFGFRCEVKGNRALNTKATQDVAFEAGGMYTCAYKADGDREYVDVGHHPEISTAEDTDPVISAHRVMRSFVKAQQKHQISAAQVGKCMVSKGSEAAIKVNLFANTCDPHGNTWASHNNVLAPRGLPFGDYVYPLLIHNVSHIVWSGAGHVQPTEDGGYRYCLSERADHFWDTVSLNTTQNRPLVNTRDVPYADKQRFRRIHDISGDAVMSPFVYALRRASVAIILRACGLGVKFDDLMPENPIAAIRTINHDPTLKAKVSLADGRKMSGLDLERYVMERSLVATRRAKCLTAQDELFGKKWEKLLDDLSQDPALCERRVNWVVKEELILRELEAKFAQINSLGKDRVSAGAVALQKSIEFHRLSPYEGAGMKLLRRGFFEDSPSADVLENGVPLPNTRAKVRGQAIGRLMTLNPEDGRYNQIFSTSWDVLTLHWVTNGRTMMNDPFKAEMPESLDRRLQQLGV